MLREPGDLLDGWTQISSLSIVQSRLNEEINNPRASMSNIGQIIGDDPGLTARLLRLVNSAFFGFPSKIETITRAIVIVGLQQLRDLAMATSVVNLFKGIPKHLVSMESFWQHSIACGVAARILAAYRRETNIERLFVAGMLHDIGRLIINTKVPDQARKALLRSKFNGELLYIAEREVIGFDHAAVGHALLKAWNLPPSLQEVVAYHHNPQAARRFPTETSIVHVADIIVHTMQFGTSGERFVPPLDGSAWESIGLSTSVLSPILDQVDRQANDVVQTILPDE
ncbi:MAG: HDOD domain-containing protein [Desulfobacterales bacterium]|nr:HDOD domain-containing protein [Desulfobacterales bacterium]